jgi:hypothetical protein
MRRKMRALGLVVAGACGGIALVVALGASRVTVAAEGAPGLPPVTIAGTVKTISADTDFNQLSTVQSNFGLLATGPFVITDVIVNGGNPSHVDIGPGPNCPQPFSLNTLSLILTTSISGARIVVPSGQVACTSSFSETTISGFRPY